jgi:hypothetical protein
MEGKVDALGGLLKRIGNFDPADFESDFNDRLILQKTVYLMEQFGLNIGYHFSWYLRGPYSPSLARDAYTVVKTYSQIQPVKFDDPTKEKRFGEFLAFIKPFLRKHANLEKIASIHFLCKAYPNLPLGEIYLKIKAKIPSMTMEEFKETKALLQSYGLLEDDD